MHGKTAINDIHCMQKIFIVVLTTTPDFHVISSTKTLVSVIQTVQKQATANDIGCHTSTNRNCM